MKKFIASLSIVLSSLAIVLFSAKAIGAESMQSETFKDHHIVITKEKKEWFLIFPRTVEVVVADFYLSGYNISYGQMADEVPSSSNVYLNIMTSDDLKEQTIDLAYSDSTLAFDHHAVTQTAAEWVFMDRELNTLKLKYVGASLLNYY